MNIFLVSGAAPFSTRDVWEGYIKALRGRGVRVVPYPVFSMLSLYSIDAICSDIVGKALNLRNAFDATLFIDGCFFRDEREWVPLTLSLHGMLTAVVATDDPYESITDEIYGQRFTNERACATKEVIYLPVAADLPTLIPSGPQDVDLGFVGTIFEDRWELIRDLARYCEVHRVRLEIRGHFLRTPTEIMNLHYARVVPGTVTPDERISLYQRSKVVLNVFRSNNLAESANPRVYEVTALGTSALLTGARKEVSELFDDNIYTFNSFAELVSQLHRALDSSAERQERIASACMITRSSHLYEHRADLLLDALRTEAAISLSNDQFPAEHNVCWIFGSARCGSTWLSEMLGCIKRVVVWNEPCFGWVTTSLSQHPQELDRADAFFCRESQDVWTSRLKQMFLEVAQSRWRNVPTSAVLVVKEVNAPEFAPFVSHFFPQSKYLLLIRDPFDVLDSQIDMQLPGSWNESFWQQDQSNWTEETRTAFLCRLINRSFQFALTGFRNCGEDKRLRLSYETLLEDPVNALHSCASFIGIDPEHTELESTVATNAFEKQGGRKGRMFFRRYGKACHWRVSSNFTPAIRQIAEQELGGLRTELGYK